MIYIFECIHNFLEKPYDSVENPLFVRFGSESRVGQPIADFTVHRRIGFSKSLAANAILLGAIEAELPDEELPAEEAGVLKHRAKGPLPLASGDIWGERVCRLRLLNFERNRVTVGSSDMFRSLFSMCLRRS